MVEIELAEGLPRSVGVGLAGLAICIGATFGFKGYAMLVDPGHLAFGKSEVRYSNGGTRAEARAVGDRLVAEGIFWPGSEDEPAWTLEVSRDGGRHIVDVTYPYELIPDDAELGCLTLMSWLSTSAFANEPLDILLRDRTRALHRKIPWEARRRKLHLGDGSYIEVRQGGQESEARDVARVLAQHPIFEPGNPRSVIIKRTGATHIVGFVVDFTGLGHVRAAIVARELKARLHPLADTFSEEAFGGQPVDFWLVYENAEVLPSVEEALTWDTRPR